MRRPLSDTEKQHLVDVVAQATRDGLSKVSSAELGCGLAEARAILVGRQVPLGSDCEKERHALYFRGMFRIVILGWVIAADWMRTSARWRRLRPCIRNLEGTSSGRAEHRSSGGRTPPARVFRSVAREPGAKTRK